MSKLNEERIRQFGALEFKANQVVEGFITGLHKSPFHGFSVEFAEHRQYNRGDSTKHIDWKLYGRTEKLFIKKYEEETNLRCQILIDHSGSMYFPELNAQNEYNKISFAANAAAALATLLRKQRDAVCLGVFSDKIESFLPPKTSSVHMKEVFNQLEKLLATEGSGSTNTVETLHLIAERVHKRSLIVLFTDMFDSSGHEEEEIFRALQHLKFNNHEIILFHVLDHQFEMAFDYENRPHDFIDIESGEKLKLNPKQIQAQYKEQMSEYVKKLKIKCAQFKIDLVEADIRAGFDNVLLNYLVKRSKMY